ncbi:unnamed protein product, partial [marine sediment metagenome]
KKLIPTEFNTFVSFDTVEAIKAVNSLKVLSDSKAYPIDLTIGDGKIVMAIPDDKGQAELVADTDGEGKVRIDGLYLAQALRACGGMVEFKLTNGYSPMLFGSNGYQLVVMPMLTNEADEQAKQDREAKAEQEPAEPVAEQPTDEVVSVRDDEGNIPSPAEPTKPKKARRSRAKQPVTAK